MTPPATAGERLSVPFEHRGATWTLSCLHRRGTAGSLLYLHGLGGRGDDFVGAFDEPALAGWSVTAFDAPGCGATRGYRAGVPLGVDDIVTAAEHVAEALGLGEATVVGHSMGGLAGLLLALRRPDLVAGFVNVEGNLGPEDCALYSRRIFRERFLGRERSFMASLADELRGSGAPGFARAGDELERNVQDEAFFDYCRSIVAYSDRDPLLESFVALRVPTLYVHGAANAGLSHIPRMRSAGVGVRSIADSDHFPAFSNPVAYYRALADFVAGRSR